MKTLFPFLAVVAIITTGCGQGFQTSSKALSSLELCKDCGTPPPIDPWSQVDLVGTVSAGPLGKHQVIDVDKVNNLLLIKIPVPGNLFGGGMFSIPIPQVPGMDIGIDQDLTTGQYYIVAKIPLSYLVHGVQFASPDHLPNGKPLPGVPGGELPKIGLNLTKNPMYLYLGKGAVGIFVPTPQFSQYLILDLTFPIKNKSQRKTIGYFAVVSKTPQDSGGFFLSVVLPPEIQRIIDDIIP
jgi:hypothetical protein